MKLTTKNTDSPLVASRVVEPRTDVWSQARPVVFTILGTSIFGFILWGLSEFLSLRGVVNVAASRIILLFIWIAGTLGAIAVVVHIAIRRKILAIALSSFILACSLLALDRWAPKPSNARTDVSLRFVGSKDPSLVVVNTSDVEARDMKWAVIVWNMDLPDRRDPLPIPLSGFDWLKAHSEGGPSDLFDMPSVFSLLRPGNRLFGSATIDCPKCPVAKTYVIYIVWGEGGWFSEVARSPSAELLTPKDFSPQTREIYFKHLEEIVPLDRRIKIPQ